MRIDSLRIVNFKCFSDSGEIALSPSFNTIVGQNDSGKSALLEALSHRQPNKPHVDIRTQPTMGMPPREGSEVQINFLVSGAEARSWIYSLGSLDVPLGNRDFAALEQAVRGLSEGDQSLHATFRGKKHPRATLGELNRDAGVVRFVRLQNRAAPFGIDLVHGTELHADDHEDLASHFASELQRRIYVFKAERLNIGQCSVQGSRVLAPNAENLPDALNQLSSRNHARYERYLGHVRTVFPHITRVTASLIPGNASQAHVLLWTTPPELEREDLAIPLAESGTGISQVLAILYVVVTSEVSTVIAIDEPQSFLHPGATRKLLEILRFYPQHQYIITTHSPLAMEDSSDATFLVRREEGGSKVHRLDVASRADLSMFLNEVGARLSDVFGADRILWVEGKTEEVCFPLVLRHVAGISLQGTQVLGVLSTDELTAKQASRVIEMYERLTRGAALLPPAVAFLLDREGRSSQERDSITARSKGLLQWLPRRMFENYLIDANALAARVNAIDHSRPAPLSTKEVIDWLRKHASEARFIVRGQGTYPSDAWHTNVHGAQLLKALFEDSTETRATYDKVRDGEALTRLLITRPSTDIRELAERLAEVLAGVEGPHPTQVARLRAAALP